MDSQTTPGPVFRPGHKPRADWIVVHIGHGSSKIAQAVYWSGEIPGTPEASPGSINAVEPHSVHTQQEFHAPAQPGLTHRAENKVDMVLHDHKIKNFAGMPQVKTTELLQE